MTQKALQQGFQVVAPRDLISVLEFEKQLQSEENASRHALNREYIELGKLSHASGVVVVNVTKVDEMRKPLLTITVNNPGYIAPLQRFTMITAEVLVLDVVNGRQLWTCNVRHTGWEPFSPEFLVERAIHKIPFPPRTYGSVVQNFQELQSAGYPVYR